MLRKEVSEVPKATRESRGAIAKKNDSRSSEDKGEKVRDNDQS